MATKSYKYCLFFLTLFGSFFSYSQTNSDSLLAVWNDRSQADTNRILAMQLFAEQYLNSRPDTACYYYKKASELSFKVGGKWISEIYQRIGATFFIRGQFDSTMYYWKGGVDVSEEIGYLAGMKVGYNMVGLVNDRLANYDLSVDYYNKSYDLASQQGDSLAMIYAINNLGNVLEKDGEHQKATENLESALELALLFGHEIATAKVSSSLAWIYTLDNRFQEAIELYNTALKVYEKSNDKFSLGAVYGSLAWIYNEIEDHEKAISLYKQSIGISKDLGNEYDMAAALLNISNAYIGTNQFEQALQSSSEAKTIFEDLGALDGVAAANNNMGDAHLNLGNYKLALECFIKSKAFQDKIGKGGTTSVLYANLGMAYLNLGETDKAIEYGKTALKMAKASNDLSRQPRCYNVLYEAYALLNQYDSAYKYLNIHVLIRDSIVKEQNKNEVIRKEYAFEYEKQALADSLKQEEAALKLELAHQEEIAAKNQTRNVLGGAAALVLLLAGGAWRRSQFIKKASKQLAIEKQKAEEGEAFKQSFLANMSHEIRTPMNAILGMTNLTLDTQLSDKQKNYLEAVKQSSESLLVIINDILDISKLEASGLILENIPFHLKEVVNQVKTTLQFKAEEKSLELKIEMTDDLPEYVVGDPTRLGQILMNLCGNAIKFTEKGSVSLQLSKTTNGIHFSVKDTGLGIPEEQQAKLFDSFQQVDASTTRKYGGTGLGLSIAKSFVDLMGGELKLSSAVGKGSTFYFTIELPAANAEMVKEMASAEIMDYSQLKGLRILLAEDNQYNQIVVVDTLLNLVEEVKVDVAKNGKEAIEMHQQNSYDVILMDSDMPEMDGRQATEVIRKLNSSKKDIPIIALTASVLASEIDKCIAAGMNDSIPKPFKRDEFFRTIGKYYKS